MKYFLPASTLIESLAALLLVMLCFGISCMIYVNVINADKSRQKLKAHDLITEMILQLKKDKNFTDQITPSGELVINSTFRPYKENEKIKLLTLTVSDKMGRKLESQQIIILNDKE